MPAFSTLILLLALSLPFSAFAVSEQGYETVDLPVPTSAGDNIEVIEFFWYGCPHCFDLEPEMNQWLKTKPENVVFKREAPPLKPSWAPHSRFFYSAELLGLANKLHEPLFDALHKEKRRLNDKESLIAFAVAQGVDEGEFRRTWDSFAVHVRIQQSRKLASQYRINGVPAVAINGKYKTSGSLAGTYSNMLKVMDELIARESKPDSKKD